MKYIFTVIGLGALVFAADLSCNRGVAPTETVSLDKSLELTRAVKDDAPPLKTVIGGGTYMDTQVKTSIAAAEAFPGDVTIGV